MAQRRRWPGGVELDCEFLGQHRGKDLYICPGGAVGPSVIVRRGAEDSDYHSEPYFAYARPSPADIRDMEEALRAMAMLPSRRRELRKLIRQARQRPLPHLPESREAVRRWEQRHGKPLTKRTRIRPSDPSAYRRWKRQLREHG